MYDAAIIGAGVVGSAIARELSKYNINACVIEKDEDVCSGTSKANSAIVHAGYDATPGTLKAQLNVEGNSMMDKLAEELDFPFKRNGSLVICTEPSNLEGLEKLYDKGQKNNVPGLKIIGRKELINMEPNVSDDACFALYAPTGGIVCPFNLTIALAENAYTNGIKFLLDTKVDNITPASEGYDILVTRKRRFKEVVHARAVINAAGVYADEINNMVSAHKLHITARKGEYMLLDKTAGDHVKHTIFQLPGKMGKGILVTPTVHGNLLVGPTAVDVDDKEAINTTADGLETVAAKSSLAVKNVPLRQVITSFAGLRAHEAGDDFVIGEASDADLFFNAAGIESPGLSSAPAIGIMVAKMVADRLGLTENKSFDPIRKGILNPSSLSIEDRNALIKKNPAYGNIICRCEMITEGEIIDSIRRPLGARSLDGIKRRTRAGMGRCQAGFCSPRTMEILEREVPMSMYDITKSGGDSTFIVGRNKEL